MSLKSVKNIEGFVVNTKVIATILGVTERRVRQLVEEEVIEKVGTGRFNLLDTMKRYIAYIRVSKSADNEISRLKESLDYEKFLHERAKREAAELELAQMKGTMHRAEDVEQVMNKMLSDFRARLLAMPTKVAPMLIARNEIAVIQDLLQKQVFEALQELCDYDPVMFIGDKYIDVNEEDPDALEGEDDVY